MIPGSIIDGAARLLGRIWPYLLGGAAVIALWIYVDHRGYQRGADEVRAEWGKAQAKAAEAALEQERKNAAETARRYAAQQEIVNDKDREIAAARRDAGDACAYQGLSASRRFLG